MRLQGEREKVIVMTRNKRVLQNLKNGKIKPVKNGDFIAVKFDIHVSEEGRKLVITNKGELAAFLDMIQHEKAARNLSTFDFDLFVSYLYLKFYNVPKAVLNGQTFHFAPYHNKNRGLKFGLYHTAVMLTITKTGLRIDQIERHYAGGTMISLLNVDNEKTEQLKNSLFKAVTEIY